MKINDMALEFAQKNPDLLRDIMSSHFVRIEKVEFSNGRLTKCAPIEKHYKDQK
jgi:hypothetical protein